MADSIIKYNPLILNDFTKLQVFKSASNNLLIFRGIINSNGDFLQIIANGAEKNFTLASKIGDNAEEAIVTVKQLKDATISGTTAASGYLVTHLSSNNYTVISAYCTNMNCPVVPVEVSGEWWFLVYNVDNNDGTRLKGLANSSVNIKYYYLT